MKSIQHINGQGVVAPKTTSLAQGRTSPRPVLAADLFAGAGGFSKAAENSGIEVRIAIEKDSHACETYRHNLAESSKNLTLLEKDIREITLTDLNSHFDPGECDLVLGGPPCQGFSVHRICDAGVDDPRNLLIHRYFEVVQHLRPSVFLMENVPGLLWDRHAEYLELFYQMAEDAGFRVHEPVVLDARDFGVPQRRKRVFILGVDAELASMTSWPPPPTHGNAAAIAQNSLLKPWVSCANAFVGAPKSDVNDIHMNHSQELVDAFAKTPPNGGSRRDSGRVLKCHLKHDGHKDVYGRIDRRLPALWKNAYDAYARSTSLQIFDGEIMVAGIYDNGHGMSRDEFVNKWLVVGTESKIWTSTPPEDRNGLPYRSKQGKKGIGRLSSGYLGNLLLIATKRQKTDYVASLIDWRIFENPFLLLDDIRIPLVTFPDKERLLSELPALYDKLMGNVWGDTDNAERTERIRQAWESFDKIENPKALPWP